MAGKPKLKIYQYSSEYKYLRAFETQSEVFDKYYEGKKGRLFTNPDFRELPDGTFVSPYRIGRDRLRQLVIIDNDPLCQINAKDKSVAFINRKNKTIATFSSIRVAEQLTGIDYSTIQSELKSIYHGGNGLLVREVESKTSLINEVLETSRIAPKRYVEHVMLKMVEEVGELAQEVNINSGFIQDKEKGEDGIIGEAIDVIQCALDVIWLYSPDVTEEELTKLMVKKLNKWKSKFQ